jgi:hypothetical protein
MRLYGILKDDLIGEYIIDNTSTSIEDFKHTDNVYYTDNSLGDPFDFYSLFEDNTDADWLPYNCTITEEDMYYKNGKYYYDGYEPIPKEAMVGTRITIYKEGKLVQQQFKPY